MCPLPDRTSLTLGKIVAKIFLSQPCTSPDRSVSLPSRKAKQPEWEMREAAKYFRDQSQLGSRKEEKLLKKNKPVLGQESLHSIRKLALPLLASGQGPAAQRNGIITYLASCHLLPPQQKVDHSAARPAQHNANLFSRKYWLYFPMDRPPLCAYFSQIAPSGASWMKTGLFDSSKRSLLCRTSVYCT